VRVVVAPDGFGGTLSAPEAAAAIADGWRSVRPADVLVVVPMSDGGEGLLAAVAGPGDRWVECEVAGPLGRPRVGSFLLRSDGTAVLETAEACGLRLLDPAQRSPLHTTTFGVGQLMLAAREAGARRLVMGLGGSATVDAGAGALSALGFRLRVADGSGLKIGGGELLRLRDIGRDWVDDAGFGEVQLLADVRTPLVEAAVTFGPQKGAGPAEVGLLREGLQRFAEVAERDLGAAVALRTSPGTGAAGGLGYGLTVGLGATSTPGAAAVAELVGLGAALERADLVVTGEGRLDATTREGKVVARVATQAAALGLPCQAVVGQIASQAPGRAEGLTDVEAASPAGPGPRPADEVAAAAARLAARFRP